MAKKISKLTEGQRQRFGEWVERWTRIGLCTDPADWATFGRAALECYRLAGLDTSGVRIVHTTSPLAVALAGPIAASILNRTSKPAVAVGVAVRDAVGDAVGGAVHDAVRGAVDDAVRVAVGVAVRVAVGDAVGGAVGGIKNNWHQYLGGQFWVSWQAYESFFDEVCGLEHPKLAEARAYRAAQSSAGWWWPHKRFIVVSDRPETIRMESGRLHSDDGMAIRWRDGWGLWMIGGVRVDEQIVMRPETQSLAQIDKEANAEVKRIRIERYGWERYLTEKNATVVEHRRNDIEGTEESLMRCGDMSVLVCVCPSTGKVFSMEVDPRLKTCREAQNYLSNNLADRIIGAA